MTLGDWLKEAERRLADAGIEEPRVEARLLAVHALGKSKAWILAHQDEPPRPSGGEGAGGEGRLEEWLHRRENREPLAHITGTREFYGRPFKVTPDTLVPRPETEVVVDLALQSGRVSNSVLDIGTGTGCIGITLALERPELNVTLLDISERALKVARENAQTLGANVETIQSDLYSVFTANRQPPTANFDLIVSNPPYIRADEPLMPEVAQYEPAAALYGGEDGLAIYRRLAAESAEFLDPDGTLVVEIGYDQAESVPALFKAQGWRLISLRTDLAGITRALSFRYRP